MSSTPNNVVDQARHAWLIDQHETALSLFRQATSSAPDDLRLAVEFASYLGLRFEIDEAREILNRCEARLAEHPSGLYQVGLAYERAFSPEQALRCFRRAGQADSDHYLSHIKIAEWYDRRGMLDEARLVLDQSEGDAPELWLARAHQHSRHHQHDEAEAILSRLTSRDDTPRDVLVRAWYALAQHYDTSGKPELA